MGTSECGGGQVGGLFVQPRCRHQCVIWQRCETEGIAAGKMSTVNLSR
jgi:hypothetical protein